MTMAEEVGLDELVAASRAMRLAIEQTELIVSSLRSPSDELRDEGLTLLAEMVTVSYGEDGKALGRLMRESGVVVPLTQLLSDANPMLRKKALLVVGNLCSDAVDAESAQTKAALLQAGADRSLFTCLVSTDEEIVVLACAALQNVCHDYDWSQRAVQTKLPFEPVPRLEQLAMDSNSMVARYAAGALRNMQIRLHEHSQLAAAEGAGVGATSQGLSVSAEVSKAIDHRWREARLEDISRAAALRKIAQAVLIVPTSARARRLAARGDARLAAAQEQAVRAQHAALRANRRQKASRNLLVGVSEEGGFSEKPRPALAALGGHPIRTPPPIPAGDARTPEAAAVQVMSGKTVQSRQPLMTSSVAASPDLAARAKRLAAKAASPAMQNNLGKLEQDCNRAAAQIGVLLATDAAPANTHLAASATATLATRADAAVVDTTPGSVAPALSATFAADAPDLAAPAAAAAPALPPKVKATSAFAELTEELSTRARGGALRPCANTSSTDAAAVVLPSAASDEVTSSCGHPPTTAPEPPASAAAAKKLPMEARRHQRKRETAALVIQAAHRDRVSRAEQRKHAAASPLQRAARARIERNAERKHAAASSLQRAARARLDRNAFLRAKTGAATLQKGWRGARARMALAEARDAADKIASAARFLKCRRELAAREAAAATRIAATTRAVQGRKELKASRDAATTIAATRRARQPRREFAASRGAAITIQAAARGLQCRKDLAASHEAATAIGAAARALHCRMELAASREAASIIAAAARARQPRRELGAFREAATLIASAARTAHCRKELAASREAATVMQTAARSLCARKELAASREAATTIQAASRALQCRKALSASRGAAITIETAARALRCRRELAASRSAATKLQAAARRHACARQYTQQRAAATALQAAARSLPCRRNLEASRTAATAMQAVARRNACVAHYQRQRWAATKIATAARGKAARTRVEKYRRAANAAARVLQAAQRQWLRRRQTAARVLQAGARRRLLPRLIKRKRLINEKAIDDFFMSVKLTPRPPEQKRTTARRTGRSATGERTGGTQPRSRSLPAHRSSSPKVGPVDTVAKSPRSSVPLHQKGTLTRAGVPPRHRMGGGATTAADAAVDGQTRPASLPTHRGGPELHENPRSHIRTTDPSMGWDTYVARRVGPSDGLQLPPLPKPVLSSVLRPRRAFADSYW